MFFSAIWAFIMPPVTNSVYFHNSSSGLIDQPTTSTTIYSSTAQIITKSMEAIKSNDPKKKVILMSTTSKFPMISTLEV